MELVIRTVGSKVCVYQAVLLGEPKCETFMGKEENVKLSALKLGDEKEQKPVREVVKMQFTVAEEVGIFKKAASDFFSKTESNDA